MKAKQIKLQNKCPFCGKVSEITCSEDGYKAWRNGTLAQEALPELSASEREVLISGICDDCWSEMSKLAEEAE